jgi:hypothetical protein
MTYIAHIAIHAPEDMVIARAGMGGIDEYLHSGYRVVLCAEQSAVVVARMDIRSTKGRGTMYKGKNF